MHESPDTAIVQSKLAPVGLVSHDEKPSTSANAEEPCRDPELRLLTFTSLYPNAVQPHHGVFVETRLRQVLASGGATARVVAPVPWFPSTRKLFGSYATFANVPRREVRHGIEVVHPRFIRIPKVGMTSAPYLLYRAAVSSIEQLRQSGYAIDLIDAHYFYPDGVAAVMLGQRFGLPVTITARGTDINLIPEYALPRRQMLWAASRAAAMISVCQALKDEMIRIGIDGDRVEVLRNGVDLDLFRPLDRETARHDLSIGRPAIASIGHLIPRKGHDLVIAAMPSLPGVELLIVGDEPQESALRAQVAALDLRDRVRFLGRMPHVRLPELYSAVDVVVLASSREGWANVLLESMSCGTPVVASNVWGTPEVVATREAGRLLRDRTPEAVVAGVSEILAGPPNGSAVRAYAEGFSWDETTQGQLELFHRIAHNRAPPRASHQ